MINSDISEIEAVNLRANIEGLIKYKNDMNFLNTDNKEVEGEEAVNNYINKKIIKPITTCIRDLESVKGKIEFDAKILIDFLLILRMVNLLSGSTFL